MWSRGLVRVAAPGLPPVPKLMFDPTRRRAVVSARHATWQSHEWGSLGASMIIVTLSVGLGIGLWRLITPSHKVLGMIAAVYGAGITYGLAVALLHKSWTSFLARRVFATHTILWFTSEAIGFRSRLYSKPVIVWRKWHSIPVRIRFIVQPDRNALARANSLQAQHKLAPEPLKNSSMLELVLTASDKHRMGSTPDQDAILRTVPITEVDSQLATKMTMVYTAAITLTAPVHNTIADRAEKGRDIDAL